jgi:hypothetical protein
MICCGSGSGSDFRKVLFPVQVSVLAPIPVLVPDPENIYHSFPKAKKLHNILPFHFQKQLISHKVGLSLSRYLLKLSGAGTGA